MLPPVRKIAVHLAVGGDVFDRVFLCCFPNEMFWTRSGTELSQFLRVFLSILPVISGDNERLCAIDLRKSISGGTRT